ncbi:ATP synthase subunit I [Aquicoccus sp. SU-CL01552]|uniref:N-ATPase subunit AtpR n=1 Tax=Aquicoccus sp. SU-CL01552 TaxID=3127656 RepID=UPI003107998D
MTVEMMLDLALGVLTGAALGALHLAWLWRAAARLRPDGSGALALVGGAVLRLAVVLAGFAGLLSIATQPALALVGALAGFALIRAVAVRRARRG